MPRRSTAPAGAPGRPFWGTALALAFLALLSGLLTASLERIPNQRPRLIAAGAPDALTILGGFALFFVPLLPITA